MHKQVIVKHALIRGKRVHLSAQNGFADEVVSALSVPPEEMPLPPLSPLSVTPKRKRKPFGLAIAAVILIFAPFLCSSVFYFLGLILSRVLPFEILIALLIFTGILSVFGGLLLYLAARRTNYLRMSVGWVTLALFVLQVDFLIVFMNDSVGFYMEPTNAPSYTYSIIISALILTCMITLCVFSVLMLVRMFKKKRPDITE